MSEFIFYSIKNHYENIMKPVNELVQLFEFHFRNNRFSMVFNSSDENWKFVFVKAKTQEELTLPVSKEFSTKTFISLTKLKELRKFFEIPYNPNSQTQFSPFDLFKTIDTSIHPIVSIGNRYEKARTYHFPNPNAIYYDGMHKWSQDSTLHHTKDNHAKVQIYLPEIFEVIKNEDITVYFTETPKDKKTEKTAIKLDFDIDVNLD